MLFGIQRQPSALKRTLAAMSAGLVLALTVFSASPQLHGLLHGHEAAASNGIPGHAPDNDTDEGCVVTLFAQGLVLCLALYALVRLGEKLHLLDYAAYSRVTAEEPAYLHLPPQAPPAV